MKGIDYLGLGHKKFPLSKVAKYTPPKIAIGLFWDTFGDGEKAIKKLLRLFDDLKKPYPPAIRIHVWWAKSKVIVPISTLKRACIRIDRLAQDYPGIAFFVSHSCEHGEKNVSTVEKRMWIIKRFAPHCIPVNCIGEGARLADCYNENHPHEGKSSLKPPYIVSNDGRNIFEMNVPKYFKDHKDAEIAFVWTNRFNLRDPGEDKPPPPKQRTKLPSDEIFKQIAKLVK